jgi:hypothetical protein
MLITGNRRIIINIVVNVFIEILYIAPKIENELLTSEAKRNKRKDETNIDSVAVTERLREKTMLARNIGRGNRKRREAVPSANKLAIRYFLGLICEVKMKSCSYSNAVVPR